MTWRVSCVPCAALAVGQSADAGFAFTPNSDGVDLADSDAQSFADGYATVALLNVGGRDDAPRRWRWLQNVYP